MIYVSSARGPLSKEELVDILTKSRTNNAKLEITGLLLYREGNFMQMIEGERSAVEKLYARIADDPRHGGIISLFRGEVTAREFPDWSMGFRDLQSDEVRSLPGFNEFLNAPLSEDGFSGSQRAKKVFSVFKR